MVTGIVGIRRVRVTARGQADHARTTPMGMRKDAGTALVRLANRIQHHEVVDGAVVADGCHGDAC